MIHADTLTQGTSDTKLCTVDPWIDCTCMNLQKSNLEYYDLVMFADQPDALTQFLAGPPPDPPSPLFCVSSKPPLAPAYLTPKLAYDTYADFCKGISPGDTWNINSTFFPDTPEHFALLINGNMASSKWSSDLCNQAFKSILDNCDGNDPVCLPCMSERPLLTYVSNPYVCSLPPVNVTLTFAA